MDNTAYIIYFATNLFRTIIIIRFFDLFLHSGKTKYTKLGSYIFFFMATGFGHLLLQSPAINVFTNIAGLFLISLTYRGKFAKKILIVFLIYGINMICDTIVMISLLEHLETQPNSQIPGLITVLLILVCQILIDKIVMVKSHPNFIFPQWKFLILIPICEIAMLHYMVSIKPVNKEDIVIESMGLLLINMISFYMYISMEHTVMENIEKKVLEKQTEIYSEQVDIIMKTHEKIRLLQHDMRFHLRELMIITENDGSFETVEYLKKMSTYIENPLEYVYSGNKGIDGILNYMLSKSADASVNFNVEVKIPENLKIDVFDFNILISNLLQNAIDAALDSEDKKINIKIFLERGLLFITLENSYNGTVKKAKGELITKKKNTLVHGYGLKSVDHIIEKYNGEREVSYNDKEFRSNIMLYLTNN